MKTVKDLKIKIFADGANIELMKETYKKGIVKGFTTNPTLMKNDGVRNYEQFAKDAISAIPDLPLSFEVFSDDFETMEKEALKIASWGKNVYVKIPISNTKGESSVPLIEKLSKEGIALNITAILTMDQIKAVSKALSPDAKSIISVFAGRIANTGIDPIPYMKEALNSSSHNKNAEVLWASPRELLNIFQADDCGCHIITVVNDILKNLSLVGKDLNEYSMDTVKMFYNDATKAGFKIL